MRGRRGETWRGSCDGRLRERGGLQVPDDRLERAVRVGVAQLEGLKRGEAPSNLRAELSIRRVLKWLLRAWLLLLLSAVTVGRVRVG
jgi:hypothetical protein